MEATRFLRACGKVTGPWAQVPSADRGSGIRPRAVLKADVRAEGPGTSKGHHAYADSLRHGHPARTRTQVHTQRHTRTHPHTRTAGEGVLPGERAGLLPASPGPPALPSFQPLRGFEPASQSGSEGPRSPPRSPPAPPVLVSLRRPSLLCHHTYSCPSLRPFSGLRSSSFPFLPSLPSSLPPFSLSLFPYLASLLPSPSLQPSLSFPSFPLIRLLSRAPPGFIMHPVQTNRNVLWYLGRAMVSACCRPACLTPVAPCSS